MKKISSLFLCFFTVLCLAGCDISGYPSETNMEYMASSLGFSKANGGIKALAEIIVVNSDSKAEGTAKTVMSAEGETVETAIYNLRATLAKPLMLNHCGLLVLDRKLSREQITDIWDYCFKEKSITQAIEAVCTDNAEKLLNLKPSSAVAMGYEISTALKQNREYTGVNNRNRYYQIENLRRRKSNSYAVPFLSVIDQKHKIEGLQVYYNDMPFEIIKEDGAAMFSMLNNSFKQGTVNLDKKCFNVGLGSVNYSFSYKNNKLSVILSLNLEGGKDGVDTVKNSIKNIRIYEKDVYGIADEIYRRDLKLWNRIKDNYEEIFAAADIDFRVRRNSNG